MGYKRAEQILPQEIIELIQEYIDGENIYIPRKKHQRKEWGEATQIRQELTQRNNSIFEDYLNGMNMAKLSKKYFLSSKSIQRIIHKMKNEQD